MEPTHMVCIERASLEVSELKDWAVFSLAYLWQLYHSTISLGTVLRSAIWFGYDYDQLPGFWPCASLLHRTLRRHVYVPSGALDAGQMWDGFDGWRLGPEQSILNEGSREGRKWSPVPYFPKGRAMHFLCVVPWLILPVVICLFQRLSYECFRANHIKVKVQMAH